MAKLKPITLRPGIGDNRPSATMGVVALQENRNYIGTDLNPDYLPMAEARIREERPPAPASEPDEDDDGVLGLFGGAE